jgi:hypothetical protein
MVLRAARRAFQPRFRPTCVGIYSHCLSCQQWKRQDGEENRPKGAQSGAFFLPIANVTSTTVRRALEFYVGTIVDLLDPLFGWRGKYKIVLQKSNFDKVKIQNLKTNSQQFVSKDRLRPSQLPQFSLNFS